MSESHPALVSYAEDRPQIEKVRYTHDAMIDMIVGNPRIAQHELARYFGYTQAWISTIMSSDAFQARLGQRRSELVDPALTLSIEERLKAMATRSLEILQEKLSQPSVNVPDALALKALELGAKGLGIGGNAPPRTVVINADEKLNGLANRLTSLLQTKRKEVEYETVEVIEQSPIPAGGAEVRTAGLVQGQPGERTIRPNNGFTDSAT